MHHVARIDAQEVNIAKIPFAIGAGIEHETRETPGFTREHAPRGKPAAVPITRRDLGVRRLSLEPHLQRQAAPMLARPAGIRCQAITLDLDGYLGFVDLDRGILQERGISP